MSDSSVTTMTLQAMTLVVGGLWSNAVAQLRISSTAFRLLQRSSSFSYCMRLLDITAQSS